VDDAASTLSFYIDDERGRSHVEVGKIALSRRRQILRSRKQCESGPQPGRWDVQALKCWQVEQVYEACAKIRFEGGEWVPDTSGGGAGCYAKDGWAPARYKYRKYDRSADSGSGGADKWINEDAIKSKIEISVRSCVDPLIAARNATSDSLLLPEPPRVTMTGGVITIIIGFALSIPALAHFAEQRARRQRALEVRTPPDSVTPPLEWETEAARGGLALEAAAGAHTSHRRELRRV